MVAYIMESTLVAILAVWVLTHASEFTTVIKAVEQATVGSTRALIGKNVQ